MADKLTRIPQNVLGSFYVDATCLDCDLCRHLAPIVFRRDDVSGISYVFHQPETPAELAAALEALNYCPTDSIGNDG